MTHEQCRLLIPQYLSGQLTPSETFFFESEVARSTELQAEVEELRQLWEGLRLLPQEQPGASLRARFYQRLSEVENRRPPHLERQRTEWWKFHWWPQLAGGLALFAFGLLLGRTNINTNTRAPETELAQLRTEVQGLQQTIALSLLERQSATSRLEGVSWSSRVTRPDGEIVSALLDALNHDPNVNVRLSAIDALERFSDEMPVRQALATAIPSQDSPLVQIALIDSLVHIRDNAAAPEFRKLAHDSGTNEIVRQRAQWGLQKLGFHQ
jgi:hypothetical protein